MYKILFFSFLLLISRGNMRIEAQSPDITEAFVARKLAFRLNTPRRCVKIKQYTGSLILFVFATPQDGIKSFNILSFDLKDGDKTICFYNKYSSTPLSIDEYPKKLMPYYSYIDNYVKEIQFILLDSTAVNAVERITFKVNIGDCKH